MEHIHSQKLWKILVCSVCIRMMNTLSERGMWRFEIPLATISQSKPSNISFWLNYIWNGSREKERTKRKWKPKVEFSLFHCCCCVNCCEQCISTIQYLSSGIRYILFVFVVFFVRVCFWVYVVHIVWIAVSHLFTSCSASTWIVLLLMVSCNWSQMFTI